MAAMGKVASHTNHLIVNFHVQVDSSRQWPVKRREMHSLWGTSSSKQKSGSKSEPSRLSRHSLLLLNRSAHPEETYRHIHVPVFPARLFCHRSMLCRAGQESFSKCPSKNPRSVRSRWPSLSESAQIIPQNCPSRGGPSGPQWSFHSCVCSGSPAFPDSLL